MTERIDVRGFSCPTPLIMTEKMMKKMKSGTFEVISDCGTSRVNVVRHAHEKGWDVKEEETNEGDFLIVLSKK